MIIEPLLKKYFMYDRLFNLVEYDSDMSTLVKDLRPFIRDKYEDNYRFIFLHYDTDYHITNDQPGLILRNLQRIVWHLDISNYFCLVLSQKDLQPDLDRLCLEETTDQCAIACITHRLQDLLYLPQEIDKINIGSIDRKYLCLNRRNRAHHLLTFSLLSQHQLLDHGLVSYNVRNES